MKTAGRARLNVCLHHTLFNAMHRQLSELTAKLRFVLKIKSSFFLFRSFFGLCQNFETPVFSHKPLIAVGMSNIATCSTLASELSASSGLSACFMLHFYKWLWGRSRV